MQTDLKRHGAGLAVMAMMGVAATGVAASETVADLAEQVTPSVVTVLTEAAPAQPDDMREFFRRFGAPQAPHRAQPRQGLGSGFIIDEDGWIVTNDHVVDGAERVTVRLSDERSFDAEVIGADPLTDLALLRIETDAPLPAVPFGDSDALRVGEDVMAVGNPFGLGGTVTTGIVSAKNRSITAGAYADFIQTDAAINRGNSGGPLFNMDGEVVGVNSAIFSPNGGSVGVGFAVAANVAKQVIADLRDDGLVSRGFLGVTIQSVTAEIAEALGLDAARGALVASVNADGPSQNRLQSGDVIVALDGVSVDASRDLPRLVGMVTPGDVASLTVVRDGDTRTVRVTVGTAPGAQTAAATQGVDGASAASLGARVADLTPEARARLNLDDAVRGALIADVAPDGAAARAGLRAGDVILRVDAQDVADAAALRRALRDVDDASALMLVRRGGAQIFVAVALA